MKVSVEEQLVLNKLSIKDLSFFKRLANDKEFSSLKNLMNTLIDYEKNFVCGFNGKTGEEALAEVKYAKGGINMLRKLIEIILASEHEITKRENNRKNTP